MRKMKRWLTVLLVVAVLATFAPGDVWAVNPAHKLGRGLANIATGWLEIPVSISKTLDERGDIAGLFVGPFVGISRTIGRTLSGVYETVTFPVPFPAEYKHFWDPEFIFGSEIEV